MDAPIDEATWRAHSVEHNYTLHYSPKPGDIYVEVGAFWGTTGIKAAKQGATAFLVEPSPNNVAAIKLGCALERTPCSWTGDGRPFGTVAGNSPDGRVYIIEKAVCDRRGRAKYIVAGNPAGHRLDNAGGTLETVEVETDTLEGVLGSIGIDHVDLLSCDMEDHEIELVNYSGDWLKGHKVKNLALGAYHRDHMSPTNSEVMMPILKAWGYQDVHYEEHMVFGRAP